MKAAPANAKIVVYHIDSNLKTPPKKSKARTRLVKAAPTISGVK